MGIYKASFPSPNPAPGEDPYDTIDTDELGNTKLNDESIREFNEDKTIHVIKYELKRRQVMPTNVEEIYIQATSESIPEIKPEEVLDIQTFTDEVARGAYQRKTPDSSAYIIEAKTKLKTLFANQLLDNGSLAINTRYNSFGYIYSGDDKIGTFENISIDSESEFTIDDSQSIIDLENAINLSVQLYIEKTHAFLISIDRMKSKNSAMLGSISRLDKSNIPVEALSIKTKEEYDSEEEFFADRRAMINTSLVTDNFEDALDDIDI